MENAPIIANVYGRTVTGPYSVTALVDSFRRDPQNVLDAIDFQRCSFAAGNVSGSATYARALAAYFWTEGFKDRARDFMWSVPSRSIQE